MRKRLLCRLGWHTSQYLDSALFASALRCNHCNEWVHKEDGRDVERTRAAFEKNPPSEGGW